MKAIKSVLFFFICMVPFSAQAVGLVLEAGVHAGGDDLVTVTFGDGSTDTIAAGDGISVAIGARFDLDTDLTLDVTYGVKMETIQASNGGVDWTRSPLNGIALYKMDDWRFGGGLTYHMSPVLEGNGAAAFIYNEFDSALGALIDVRYVFGETAYVGGRATFIDYTTKDGSATVNGNSIGIIVGVVL